MTQTMYAYMNKWIKKKKSSFHSIFQIENFLINSKRENKPKNKIRFEQKITLWKATFYPQFPEIIHIFYSIQMKQVKISGSHL
jgi:hypothetical protein